MTNPDHRADYVVFPKVAFFEWMGAVALPPWPDVDGHHVLGGDVDCAPLAERIVKWVEQNDLSNVVLGLLNDGPITLRSGREHSDG